MLLYPTQGHQNEHFTVTAHDGFSTVGDGTGRCLSQVSSLEGYSRTIGVTWKELGLPSAQDFAVRDLWNQTDVGVHRGSFAVDVGRHEARMFTFTPLAVV